MPAPAIHDIIDWQGNSIEVLFWVTNDDGTLRDYSGYTAKAQVRADVADVSDPALAEFSATVLEQTKADGTPSETRGHILLRLTPAQTSALPLEAVWDVQVTNTGGTVVDTPLAGKIILRREVTR